MSEQIREQVSAFLDGELPNSETELLLKRLTRDTELRESFGRYALIGESIRGANRTGLTRGFAARVNGAIDGESAPNVSTPQVRAPRWWRTVAGGAVAASVAAVAVVALQQRAIAPGVRVATNVTAPSVKPLEPISYTVPTAAPDAPAVLSSARLTRYVFAHSNYSSGLGQSNVLSGLLADPDEAAPPAKASAVHAAALDAGAANATAPAVRQVQPVSP